jgi:hypothetical protein
MSTTIPEELSASAVAFLMSLSTDPVKANEFRSNPDGILAGTPLSDEDKALLKSADALRIQQAVAGTDTSWGAGSQAKYVRLWEDAVDSEK